MDYGILIWTSKRTNSRAPKAIVINKDSIKIGRSSEIKIDTNKGKEISKHHCTITRVIENDGRMKYFIEDHSSINGTFVNGRKIKKIELNNNDEVVFGGGSEFYYGDILTTTAASECRYQFVNRLPSVLFLPDAEIDSHIPNKDSCPECSICMSPMIKSTKLPCGHRFCTDCIRHWSDECFENEQDIACPICRAVFNPSKVFRPESYMKNGSLEVYNMECMLRSLKMSCVNQISNISIYNQWFQKDKESFWRCYDKLIKNSNRLHVFRHIVGATFQQVMNSTEMQLIRAVTNLDGDSTLRGENLKLEVLARVGNMLGIVGEKKKVYHLRCDSFDKLV